MLWCIIEAHTRGAEVGHAIGVAVEAIVGAAFQCPRQPGLAVSEIGETGVGKPAFRVKPDRAASLQIGGPEIEFADRNRFSRYGVETEPGNADGARLLATLRRRVFLEPVSKP